MRKLLTDTANRAIDYLDSLPERPVRFDPGAAERVAEFDVPLGRQGRRPAEIIAQLDDIGTAASVAMAGPRYFGFVIGGCLPASVAANWLATAWDQNSGLYSTTPVTATLESVALDWMLDLLNLPAGCAGSFVTGATVANFVALAAARNSVLNQAGWDVEVDGLFGAPPIDVIISEESHPSVYKSLGMLGLGRGRVRRVAIDGQGRMRADALPAIAGPTMVVTQVGNVNTGACDPVAEICAATKSHGAWVHVDGAFGLWAAAAPDYRHLVTGMEDADSWATDAHKWLNVPYDSGIALVRRPEALAAAMSMDAAYLMKGERRDPFDFTPEASRRMRGVEVWAALKSLGRKGLADLIERNCRQAARFAEGLGKAGFEILNEVVLNQVLVSFGSPEVTRRVITALQAEGTCWCGGTTWQDRPAMRISVSSWATGDRDVERSLEAMIRVARAEGA